MLIRWTREALGDVERLRAFLAQVSPPAATALVRKLVAAPNVLTAHPRMGTALPEFSPRDVRRLIVGDYELRYELTGTTVFVLRIWHCREDR